ncbi:bifunctional 3-(3-hydroxy-phenyl)propionate/3-hydroxycinnamic acid hydroxylase [Amorphus sp. 3PC139-8]|uniref:bifunctional 3-(3-hydroxy-phenyl)propionate/3-hydroxycinnamic acid hydroxylase n=1 Tax=Amorphus sp. 3PC139-8 TaxID=2735676 RepID=UPI00345CF731
MADESDRFDLIIAGAGPVGMTLAHIVGASGLKVLVVEQLDTLIDYPRGVGMDDECLRTFQAIGLADKVVEHTSPHQWMEFRTAKGKTLALIRPQANLFGWPRRNAFIQPLVDKVLFEGLTRYPNVQIAFSTELVSFDQDATGVQVELKTADGPLRRVRCSYFVGCDGGRSLVRKSLGISFEGQTEATRWIVVDLEQDPVAIPNTILVCDPSRPFVSIALPHGVRRLEFMVMPGETDEELTSPKGLHGLLARVMPDPESAHVIRSRVYTHHARIAETFRKGRVLIAGDAAHLMPVWQGQGYNTGIRDATNLGWKLVEVLKGRSSGALLDTYTLERRDHAKAMIWISTTAGRIFSPTNKALAATRDILFSLSNWIPPLKSYIVQMRFKPMPSYENGAIVPGRGPARAVVGRLFIQPQVRRPDGLALLDDVIGNGFAIVSWAVDPWVYMSEEARRIWQRLDAKIIVVRPDSEFGLSAGSVGDHAEIVGDPTLALKDWFALSRISLVVLRPDRFVAAAGGPQDISALLEALAKTLCTTPETEPVASSASDRRSALALTREPLEGTAGGV